MNPVKLVKKKKSSVAEMRMKKGCRYATVNYEEEIFKHLFLFYNNILH